MWKSLLSTQCNVQCGPASEQSNAISETGSWEGGTRRAPRRQRSWALHTEDSPCLGFPWLCIGFLQTFYRCLLYYSFLSFLAINFILRVAIIFSFFYITSLFGFLFLYTYPLSSLQFILLFLSPNHWTNAPLWPFCTVANLRVAWQSASKYTPSNSFFSQIR